MMRTLAVIAACLVLCTRIALADSFADVPPEARALAVTILEKALKIRNPPAVANALEKTLRTLT